MFVNPIKHLDKTRFGINFKIEDIKCNKDKKIENKTVLEDRENKNND